ncbi:response regulator [Variovorax soli]|uniref:response regulator n=1 Tax=Variovorax soli TaxID=376815 RepID=UPI001C3F4311|nr:response regulator [Variovorax soli]
MEGDASVRRALARAMRLAGFEVEAFATVEALLACEAPVQQACLVLDADMPGIGTIALKEALIAAGRDCPTVFTTSYGRHEPNARLARFGAVAVLHKPFSLEELYRALECAME